MVAEDGPRCAAWLLYRRRLQQSRRVAHRGGGC